MQSTTPSACVVLQKEAASATVWRQKTEVRRQHGAVTTTNDATSDAATNDDAGHGSTDDEIANNATAKNATTDDVAANYAAADDAATDDATSVAL